MKLENCKPGMKVKPKHDIGIIGVSKGEKLVIREAEEDTNDRCEGYLYFDGKGYVGVSAEYFEPVNKFEVGDEVLFDGREKCKIIFIAGEKDRMGNKYAVDFENKEDHYYEFISEKSLSPLKKKDELEVGDKFKANCGRKYKILLVEKDDFHNKTAYFSKTINGTYKGVLRIFYPNDVEEIIYD